MSKYVTMIGHDDAPHLNPPVITVEEREDIFAGMQEHERQARETGRPALGAGAIYPIREDILFIDPIPIPDWWEFAFAIDPGWNCTAGLVMARNPDTDQHYLVAEYYGIRDQPVVHALGLNLIAPRDHHCIGAGDIRSRLAKQTPRQHVPVSEGSRRVD